MFKFKSTVYLTKSKVLQWQVSVLVGIVVFLSMSFVITPPAVSKPMDNGVTSKSKRSWTAEDPSPVRIAACTAAPYATASSGLMDLFGSLPLKNSWIIDCTFGIRVEPPTSTTSCTLFLSIPESFRHFSTGAHGVAEIVHAKLLEACPRQTAGVVNSLEQGINFNSCLSRRGQGALGTLTLCSQAPDGTLVASHVLVAILPLEVLDAEIHDSLVTACHASNLIPLLLSTSTEELEKVYPVLK